MKNKLNLYIIEYAISALARQKYKNIFIFIVICFLVFLLSCVFFISNSLKSELFSTIESLPSLTITNTKGGRKYDINTNIIDDIVAINGVQNISARVWGYYYFYSANRYFMLLGIDPFDTQYKTTLQKVADKINNSNIDIDNSIFVGNGVLQVMKQYYFKDYFHFITPEADIKKLNIAGVFRLDTNLESNDMIITSIDNAREILGIDQQMATDIVVQVSNPTEIPNIVLKIKQLYPNLTITTQEELIKEYENIFNYKGGFFLSLFIVAIFTFFIIIYDKVSGMTSYEQKEIAILKAIGWSIDDILLAKFYEGFIISIFAYLVGVIFALVYVYIFQAPLLSNIFLGFDNIVLKPYLPFVFDIQSLSLVFFISVPIFIASIIFPSWRVATCDTDEILR